MKKQNGITLIALVITVIVLIILASITISAITGKNGIIQKSRAAKANTEESDELERRKTEEAKNEIKDDLKKDDDEVIRKKNSKLEIDAQISNPKEEYLVGEKIIYVITIKNKGNVDLKNIDLQVILSGISGNVTYTDIGEAVLDSDNIVTLSLKKSQSKEVTCEYIITRDNAGATIAAIANAITEDPTEAGKEINVTAIPPVANVEKLWNLTIHYVYDNGMPAASDYRGKYLAGEVYEINSPIIYGYLAEYATIRGSMPDGNVDITIVYIEELVEPPTPIATATITFRVVNGTWSNGSATKSIIVSLSADGTYTIPSSSVPSGTPNAGYSGGYWDANPSGRTINGDTTFTLTYTAVPVIPPTPGGGTGIPDTPTPPTPTTPPIDIPDEDVPL